MQQNISLVSRICDILGGTILRPLSSWMEGTTVLVKIMIFGGIMLNLVSFPAKRWHISQVCKCILRIPA
jgi:hypothetical protein